MAEPTAVQVQPSAVDAIQSRWGYHCCTFETYKKIKSIRRVAERVQRQVAGQNRWKRKLACNRVMKVYSRNDAGQRCGPIQRLPMPMPHVSSLFSRFIGTAAADEYWRLDALCRKISQAPMGPLTPQMVEFIDRLAMECAGYEAIRGRK